MIYDTAMEKLEKILIIILGLLLLSIMGLNAFAYYSKIQSVDSNDNTQLHLFHQQLLAKGIMRVEVESEGEYPDLEILLNGEVYGRFGSERTMEVIVTDQSVIQVNGSMYDEEIRIRVLESSGNIKDVKGKGTVYVNGKIENLCIIRM